MSDYRQSGNRYTAIFIEGDDGTLVRFPFDLVRFNVDKNPAAEKDLVPSGNDTGKIFEKVWVTQNVPWRQKVGADGLS